MKRLLIANKCDCESEIVVSESEGRRLADSLGMPFFLTSAKNNIRVDEVRCTVGYLRFGPIEKILCFVTSARVRRPGAASQAF